MPSPLLRAFAIAACAVMLIGGCSSSADDDAVALASLSDDGPGASGADALGPTSTTDDPPDALSFEDAQLAFAECMRGDYPQWPDPATGPDGQIMRISPETLSDMGIDIGDADLRDRLDACRADAFEGVTRPGGGLTDEQQAELEDNLLALFACVRETPGFEDLPDPDLTEGAGGFGLRSLVEDGSLDPVEFRSLIQQCQEQLGLEQLGPSGRGPGPRGGSQ